MTKQTFRQLITIKAVVLVLFVAGVVVAMEQSDVFDLVVTKTSSVVTVVGDSRNPACAVDDSQPSCVNITFDIPLENWKEFTNWPGTPAQGQLLKGRWNAEGRFETVPACAVRQQSAKEEWCKEHDAGYDCARLPVNSFVPLDCGHPPSKFIEELLRRSAR